MGSRTSVFEDVMDLPWPVGVVLATLCYPAALIVNSYFAEQAIARGLGQVALMVWPLFAALFLFASLISFIHSLQRKRLFRQNESIEKIRRLNWRQFEQFMAQYFREQGYAVAETPPGADGGIDLVLRKDGEKTYVQCKHWKASSVGVEKLREFFGILVSGGAANGVFVTTGNFTQPAADFAQAHGIRVMDGTKLQGLIQPKLEMGVSEPLAAEPVPNCPVCGSVMVKRTAGRGKNRGQQFWGCPKYPGCRGTRDN